MKTEELKDKIKELNDYFVNKLVNGDYEIVKRGEYKVSVDIDGYIFNIWIANNYWGINTYGEGFKGNFMQLEFNKKQQSDIYKNFMQDESISSLMSEIENKKKELEQLKLKLNKI